MEETVKPNINLADYVFELEVVILDKPVAIIQVRARDIQEAYSKAEAAIKVSQADRLLPTIYLDDEFNRKAI
jgi:hypothetical protein